DFLRVLLVEDDEADQLLIRTLLDRMSGTRMETEWVRTAAEGLERLESGVHDVCLLDYVMESGTGLDLLRQARARGVRTPVVLLTGKGSREVDLKAMEAGAVDYLVKGEMDPALLERTLRYSAALHRDREALRRSEERFRAMWEQLPLGLFRVGPDGEFMDANPALLRILDHPDRHLLRGRLASNFFVAPTDRARLLHTLEEQGAARGFESRIATGAGHPLRVRVTARLQRGPGGRPAYVEGSVEPLARHRPGSELEEEAAGWRVLSEIASAGIARTDSDGHLRGANPGLGALVGMDPLELDGRGVWTLVAPADRDAVGAAFESVASGERDRADVLVRPVSEEGTRPPHRLRLAAITGRGGSLLGLLVLMEAEAEGGGP
ncbi:MAG: response regulator, partial [Gemmatimonadales bacterium]